MPNTDSANAVLANVLRAIADTRDFAQVGRSAHLSPDTREDRPSTPPLPAGTEDARPRKPAQEVFRSYDSREVSCANVPKLPG